MNRKHLLSTASIFAALMVATVQIPTATAANISDDQARIEALSYAPSGTFNDERFSQFSFESEEYYEHELNDAWLGMPAYTKEGKLIGYIEDAFVDDKGYVDEIVIGLNSAEVSIEIDGDYAELTTENVKLELSSKQIARLVSEQKLASLE